MVCIIPARGGSKRLPGKNIKELGGVSVLGWVIDAAYRSNLFDSIIVSTDDSEVVDVATKHGATVHNRPAELCKDDVPDTAVIQYYMDELQPDYLCYLYPTAALTTPEQLVRGLDACRAIGGYVGCRVRYHTNYQINGVYHVDVDAGQFYWIRGGDPIDASGYIELDPMKCQDVNTAEDWAMLEAKWMIQKLTALALRQLKGHFISYVSELHEGGIDDRLEAALWAAGVIGELSPGSRPIMEHWAYTLYGDQEFEIDVY